MSVREPPGILYQMWLYLHRRALVDMRSPFSIVLDTSLQVLAGFALALGSQDFEYYLNPLPHEVALTCPRLLKERCEERGHTPVRSLSLSLVCVTSVQL